MLSALPPRTQAASSPPSWFVSNGETTVGPVQTELLLRGYLGGRIPPRCQVREARWNVWRPLEGVREIGSLRRRLLPSPALRPLNLRDAALRLPRVRDRAQLLAAALQLATQALEADAALLHRRRAPLDELVASASCGAPLDRLGEVLSRHDPAHVAALRAESLSGPPWAGLGQRSSATRLAGEVEMVGVVSTPVIVQGTLLGLLEFGRADHPFRAADVEDLVEFAARLARRIERA